MKLGLSIMESVRIDAVEQLKSFKKAGFEAFFSSYSHHKAEPLRRAADEIGMEYQSVHAPFYRMNLMWENSPETEDVKRELADCVDECVRYNIPIMVAHPFIGFGKNSPNELGVENFREIVERAAVSGIKVAFENVEGEGYLEALMTAFCEYDNVGFCWDTGHEMCYNIDKDMLALYGDRLIATHINDNVGVTGSEITPEDDLHLVPFDGVKDWTNAMYRLKKCGFGDILTFELKIDEAIDNKYKTNYHLLPFDDYLKCAYNAAKRLRDIYFNE